MPAISEAFSQARMIEVTEQGQVLDKTEHNRLGRFPEAASEDLVAGPKRNFQVFQTEVIEKILRHCGLWEQESIRGPPASEPVVC